MSATPQLPKPQPPEAQPPEAQPSGPHRTLILMRHGHSPALPGFTDHDRPLSTRGTAEAAATARDIASSQPPIDTVICSTARRTRETLDAIAAEAARSRVGLHAVRPTTPPPTPATASVAFFSAAYRTPVYAPGLYEASPEDIFDEIALADADAATILVIGHYPGLPMTALTLDPDGPRASDVRRGLPTAGYIALTTDRPWAALPDALRGEGGPHALITAVVAPG